MNGLGDRNSNRKKLSSKHLNKSDRYVLRKLLTLTSVAACFIAISFTALTRPELIKAPFQELVTLLIPQYNSTAIKKQNSLNLRQAAEAGDCKDLTQIGLKGLQVTKKLSLTQSVQMSECFLLTGQYFQSFSMLSPFFESLSEYSEAELNELKGGGEKGQAFITLILSLVAQLKFKMAHNITKNYCKEWDYSASCVGKLVLLSFTGSKAVAADEAYNYLSKLHSTSSKKHVKKQQQLGFFIHFAGAIAASRISEIEVINQRFYSAMNALQKNRHALLKLLFYEWTLALFANRQFDAIPGLVDQAAKTTVGEEYNWYYKLSALKRLSNVNQQSTTLNTLLNSRDSKLIFLSDYRVIRMLTPLVIRYSSAKKLLPIIDWTLRKYKDFKPDPKYLYELQVLKSRTLIAAEQHLKASEYLQESWETSIQGHVYMHLNGVALLLLGSKNMVQLKQAKGYFEKSSKEQLNWQSLYGKAKASIQLKQYREAEKILRALKRLRVQQMNEKNFWADMLKAELLLIAKKPKELLRMIKKRFEKQQEQPEVLELKASAYYLLGEVKKARTIQDKADLKKVNYTGFYFWNQDAPLHPMVFHQVRYGF
ncbi:MAG: tetratricopeptide repeat protein [Oligoflexales bacterium]